MQQNTSSSSTTYKSLIGIVSILLLALFSGLRDVISEIGFQVKNSFTVEQAFTIYIGLTLLFSGLIIFFSKDCNFRKILHKKSLATLIKLNIHTYLAYYLYFKAIAGAASSGVISMVDYSAIPLFAGLLAHFMNMKRLTVHFFVSFFICTLGIFFLVSHRSSGQFEFFLVPILFALASSLSSAFTMVYAKELTKMDWKRNEVVFARFLLSFLIALTHFISTNQSSILFSNHIFQLLILGSIGFYLPMYLLIHALGLLNLQSYSLLLFSIPLITHLVAIAFGLEHFVFYDALSILLIFLGIYSFENPTKIKKIFTLKSNVKNGALNR